MIGLVPQLLGVAPEKAIKLTVSYSVTEHIHTHVLAHSEIHEGSNVALIFYMDFILWNAHTQHTLK